MTNKKIEDDIIEAITHGIASNKGSLAASLHVDVGDVERALERLKRRGTLLYDGPNKRWRFANTFTIASETKATPPSQESAPAPDSGVSLTSEAASADKENQDMSNDNTTKIDAAISAAKKRTATKTGDGEKQSRPRLTAEQKTERDAAKAKERDDRKAERDKKRAEKQAERAANRPVAHMSKVEKAAAKLPKLDDKGQKFFNELTVNLTAQQLSTLSAHIAHFNRVKATERALGQKLEIGAKVRIVGGDSRFVGSEGTVTKAQRIRCYVEVEGAKRPVYLFTSDVEVIAGATKSAASA